MPARPTTTLERLARPIDPIARLVVGVATLVASLGLLAGCPARPTAPVPRAAPLQKPLPHAALDRGQPPAFARYFEPTTLRVDLEHRGRRGVEWYRVTDLTLEGAWAGSYRQLVDPMGFGAHRFDVRDHRSGKLLYRRGFGSLFHEWQTTGEAKRLTKSFSESVRFPRPRAPFSLQLFSRGKRGRFRLVFSRVIDPHSPAVGRLAPDPRLRITDLHVTGPTSKRLDILILGDGYTKGEREKFVRDARRFADSMLRTDPFRSRRGRLNLRALFVPSQDSGVSEPRKRLRRRTALGLRFNTFGSARYLMTEANLALRRVAGHAPYEALYLMANTSRYGGGGIYNLYSTFPSDNEYDEYVFIHEFGHSFGGLGDEYWTSSIAYEDMYPRGVEPWEPNLTALVGGRFKWKHLVDPKTPVPTPPVAPYLRGVVGVFEGGGYVGKGIFRPQYDCKMKSKGHVGFCRVCHQALGRMIGLYSEDDSRDATSI